MTKKPVAPTHCEVCGEEPKHKQLRPLECVSGTWLCDLHQEYPKKVVVYVSIAECPSKTYDDNGQMYAESFRIPAGQRGRIIEQTAKIVKLKLWSGLVVSVVNKLFEAKWRKE